MNLKSLLEIVFDADNKMGQKKWSFKIQKIKDCFNAKNIDNSCS